jgi:hypothetical protein
MPCQDHALVGKLIQIRCGKLLLARPLILPQHTDIAGAHIVTQDQDDIGPGRCCSQCCIVCAKKDHYTCNHQCFFIVSLALFVCFCALAQDPVQHMAVNICQPVFAALEAIS